MANSELARPRPLPSPNRDVRGVVSRVVSLARAAGRDYVAQSRAAAMAVIAVRPDLSPREAWDTVSRLRDMGDA